MVTSLPHTARRGHRTFVLTRPARPSVRRVVGLVRGGWAGRVWHDERVEIQALDELQTRLRAGLPLEGVRLQDLDLRPVEAQLLSRRDLGGLVVLGGRVPPGLAAHLLAQGAVVFPGDPGAPVDVFRAHLYTGHELYAGLDGPGGYAGTPDARAHRWSRDARESRDAYATLLRAIHDDSISDALGEWVGGRRVVGVMGGHRAARGTPAYAAAAHLGFALAARGLLVATGGGPGAMEAANLGAAAPSVAHVESALARLARVPSHHPDVGGWARAGFEALADFGPRVFPRVSSQKGASGPSRVPGALRTRPRSLGIPTWFYGHEPPNVFAEGIAKYFSNAIREDGLLARSNAGVVVLPGAAGTVQEVFQLATRLYYADAESMLPPLVLVGTRHWTQTLPVAALLGALGVDRPMAQVVHLVDTIEEAVALVAS